MSQFETVDGPWHVNIRKDHADVAAVLEYPYCFVSVCGFNNLKAWPAPGSEDTELGAFMEPEVSHGETTVYARVQA